MWSGVEQSCTFLTEQYIVCQQGSERWLLDHIFVCSLFITQVVDVLVIEKNKTKPKKKPPQNKEKQKQNNIKKPSQVTQRAA